MTGPLVTDSLAVPPLHPPGFTSPMGDNVDDHIMDRTLV